VRRLARQRIVLFTLAALVASYAVLCGLARVAYPRLLFPAPRVDAVPPPVAHALAQPAGPRLLELPQAHGGATRALAWRADPGERTVVFFHGNGQTMFDAFDLAGALFARGLGVVLVEYRGYGISYGDPPTEDAMYADAEAALDHLAAAGVPPDRIALWGYSLGTGVAAEMARRGRAGRVVLVAPFTSIVDMGKRWAPVLPVSLLMSHRFDTLAKAPSILVPTLVAHGDADEVVPFPMGQTVARALPHARFVAVRGGHHMDLFAVEPGLFDTIVKHMRSP
jgi:pimeloyl-ACP methyl ester carboxylesterase